MSTKKRVALYARVSTARDQSPAMQLDELRRVAAQREWDVVGEYVDIGQSGAKDRRPELDRLMSEIHRGKIDAVAVFKFDRFARSVRFLVGALEEFQARGVDFISIRDQIDTSTPTGRFTFHVIAGVAELERELIKERVVCGIRAAQARGVRMGRKPKQLDVADILRRRERGESLRQIANALRVGAATIHRALASATNDDPKPHAA